MLRLFILCYLAGLALAADTVDWKSRSIYQVLTDRFARTDGSTSAKCETSENLYCGGSWRGIISKLDYIKGMGFSAIMISPVSKNVEGRVSYGEAYHGYWVQDLYQLNEHFGTHEDLLDLGKEVHKRGMYLMVDIVINNMAFITNGRNPATAVDYSVLNPFNLQRYYHPYCKIKDWNNYDEAQKCWIGDDIVALPDLNTESEEVTQMMEAWIKEFVANYSIDGIRIDAAKHVGTEYLKKVAKASGVFATGEVFESDVNIACSYQNYIPSIPNYPVYFAMIKAFTAGNITALNDELSTVKTVCRDTSALVTFSENHDLPRFPSYVQDLSLAKNVLTFTILSDGIPSYYQGQELHFSGSDTPANREALWLSQYNTEHTLYQLTSILNKFRSHVILTDSGYLTSSSYPIYRDGSSMAIHKGTNGRHVIVVYSTQGENGGDYILNLGISYTPGLIVTEILSCKNYSIGWPGSLGVEMTKGLPMVFYPAHLMAGSGLCGASNVSAPVKGKKTGESTSLRSGLTGWSVMLVAGFVVLLL
ncbi:hypothetical protein GX48_01505 [Paracoccidioides brasiliensis]|nr:hypothetical protein GX48_01505 [Paracoccidioides brasiliensis]